MRLDAASQVPDTRRRQWDQVETDLHGFAEVHADVTERVRQRLEWIVRSDWQGTQRKMSRAREHELGASHMQVRRRRLTMHGGFSSHDGGIERVSTSVTGMRQPF
ncbi:hypothetical protein [Amycolatopsis sp. NPDC051061]|uniref:hypothetical protein n=1 Tax=Amycolatopsis sp. NPDC051061 TaxID=3155042 RepID=UPI003447CA3D